MGEMGSRVCTPDGTLDIPPVKARKVVDPTGAGDAYRAGLIKGITQRGNIGECAIMGSVCASFAIESYGTQSYHFTLAEFEERLNGLSSR